MSFKLKSDARVMLTALIAGGTLASTVAAPATIEASEVNTIDYSSIIKEDLSIQLQDLPIDTQTSSTELLVSREGQEENVMEELGLVLLSKDTKALNTIKDEDRIEVELEDNTLLNITGKIVHKSKIYYRAELSQSVASNIIDNYLDVKENFNAEGQEGFNLDYKVVELESKEDGDEVEIVEEIINDDKENNNFVFFLDGNEITRSMDFEDVDKKVFALQDTAIISLETLDSNIGNVEETKSINVVGENDKWYLVEMDADFATDENGEKVQGIIEKRKFSEDEIFVPDFMKLVANKKTQLFKDPNTEEESSYHVEEGRTITQLDRSENWVRLELSSGEELFGRLEDFDEVEDLNVVEVPNEDEATDIDIQYIDEDTTEQRPVKKKPVIRRRKVRKVKKIISNDEIEYKKAQGEAIGQQIADFGLQFVGGKYVWGGNSLETGVDCSGFVREVYKRFGVNLPRHSSQQGRVGRAVSLQEALPGDIVAYSGHVGLYIGNGKMVHASNSRTGIIVTNLSYSGTYHSIRRVIDK